MWRMKKNLKYWLVISILGLAINSYGFELVDSIGLEKKNNKWFIKHEVSQGETFYRLGARYGVEVEEIIQANKDVTVLSIGQVLLVPFSDLPYFIHKVEAGETLYAISTKYKVTTDDLKGWNSLNDDGINPGDRLKISEIGISAQAPEQEWAVHIVASGESLYGIAKQHSIEVDSIKAWNYLNSDEIQDGMYLKYRVKVSKDSGVVPVAATNTATTAVEVSPSDKEQYVDSFESNDVEIDPSLKAIPLPLYEERGLASLIEGTEGNKKYLALHRTAPPGTILLVRNELNNQVVFVRVIGTLPDTGANDKVIVKVSEAAWNNVHAVNSRFRVKVSYFR